MKQSFNYLKKLTFLMLVFLFFLNFSTEALLAVDEDDPYYREELLPVNSSLRLNTDLKSRAFIHEYPISSPPGRKGLEPNLKLTYNSHSSDNQNIYGYGWSDNIPYIERMNKKGVDKLYTENDFYSTLTGEIKVDTSASSSEGLYKSKIENGEYLKYSFINNEHWEVADKSGTIYKFGSSTNSRQDNPGDETVIYKWMLEEIRDTNGNYIKYEYHKDAGQIYPSKIKYTGHNNTDGVFEVEFLRESRSDKAASWNTGFEIINNYRISEIQTKINGQWAKKYELNYSTGDNYVRSALNSITESGRDENSNTTTLPEDNFEYQIKTKSWTENDDYYGLPVYFTQPIDTSSMKSTEFLVDANGDGLTDIIYTNTNDSEPGIVYLNTGQGTWSYGFDFPVKKDSYRKYIRFTDINADGLIDFIYLGPEISPVWINNGNGWESNDNITIPPELLERTNHDGVRLSDINGDGLSDILLSIKYDNSEDNVKKVFINNGDGTGWEENTDFYAIPVYFSYPAGGQGVRASTEFLIDVNGDGLVDIVYIDPSDYEPSKVFINKGKGTWMYGFEFPVQKDSYKNNIRFADVNADGLMDFVYLKSEMSPIWINNGNGWSSNDNWSLPLEISERANHEGVRLSDINGDNLPDILLSIRYMTGQEDNIKKVYIADKSKADLLFQINHNKGSITKINYKASSEYLDSSDNLLNPDLPMVLQTVENIAVDDGLGNISTTTYEYQDGDYYYNHEYDKRYAGFGIITTTDGAGNKTKTYYHQGNDSNSAKGEYLDDQSKIGKVYRVETYNDSDNLYTKSISKWENLNLGDDRDFVYKTESIESSYDGDADHRDKAAAYAYNGFGNVVREINYGEVTGNDDGTFTDIGTDMASTTIEYATDSSFGVIGFPSRKITTDQNGDKIAETKYYYDNLSSGDIDKGNLTKEEKWIENSNYIDIERTYNAYGLITEEKDPRDKTNDYTYDSFNLYVATSTNHLNHSTHAYYDYSSGKKKKTEDPNGNIFEVIYDGLDRPIEEKQPDLDNPTNLVTKTTYTYDDTSFPRSIKKSSYLDNETQVDSYTYLDGLDRPVQTRQEGEDSYITKDFFYNNQGLAEKESLPYFSSGPVRTAATTTDALYINYTYDALQRVINTVNAVGTTTNSYDNWVLTVTDAKGNTKNLYNDAYGNLIQVDEHNDSETYSTLYSYDLLGNLTRIEDALDNERGFTYDALGRLKSSEDLHAPADATFGTTYYTYDNSGNLTLKVDPKSQVIVYTYDDLNRVLTEDHTGDAGVEVNYNYDSCTEGVGRLCTATSQDAITNYTYNVLGLIDAETRTINSTDYTTGYDYNRAGNTSLITYPDASEVKYEYNAAGQLEKVSKKESGEQEYSYLVNNYDYNPLGQLKSERLNNNVDTDYTYDSQELYRLKNKYTIDPVKDDVKKNTKNIGAKRMYLSKKLALEKADGSVELFTPEEEAHKRTEESKTYLIGWDKDNKKKYKTRLYNGKAHYFDSQTRQLENIDTTLIDKGDKWEMKKAGYNARIKKRADDNFITFINDSQEVYFSLTNTALTPVSAKKVKNKNEWKEKQAKFANALGRNIDINVNLNNEALIKEVAINSIESLGDLNNKDYYEIPFRLTSNNNIDIKLGDQLLSKEKIITTNKTVQVIDDQGVVSYIWAPIAIDDTDDVTSIEIEYRKENDGIYLTKKLPVEWLRTATYPVRTDAIISPYSDEGGDGTILHQNTNWNTAHHYNTGYMLYKNRIGIYKGRTGKIQINRGYFTFDTSFLTEQATIDSATMNIYVYNRTIHDNDGKDYATVVQSFQASSTSLSVDDYDQCGSVHNPVEGINPGERKDISSMDINQYVPFNLNSTGLNWISKTGWTNLGLREGHDAEDDTPNLSNTQRNFMYFYHSEQVGTDKDPYLEINYTLTAEPTPPTELQTESQENPGSVRNITPEFSAIYNDPNSEDQALHYQIQVSQTNPTWDTLIWDSGKTSISAINEGERSSNILYGSSTPLELDGSTYYWRVKFWDDKDAEGDWSTSTAFFTMSSDAGAAPEGPTDLLVEGETNPGNVKDFTPELSAVYNDQDGGDLAMHYQIQVSTSSDVWESLIWDSGQTALASTTMSGERIGDITYAGNELDTNTTYYWRIKFWDDKMEEGIWSASTSSFTMTPILQNFSYFYDEVGNIIRIEDTSEMNSAKTVLFDYDDLYRLTRASSSNAINNQDYLRTYAYNAIGNILNKSDQGNYVYTDNGYNNPHAVTSVNGVGYGYDNNGNMVSDSVWTHDWDYRNRLVSSNNGGLTVDYGYDHDVNRVSYSDGGITTYYPNKLYNISSTGTSTKHVYAGSNLIATIEISDNGTSTYYTHTDHLGGSSVITDENGSLVQLLDYYPFGDVRLDEKQGNFDEKHKYTGHEHDDDTSLNYMKARYQNPKTGLFISKDPWGGNRFDPQTLNKYNYSRNNPIYYYDPTGTKVEVAAKDLEVTDKVGSHSYLLITPLEPGKFQDYLEKGETSFTISGQDINDMLQGKVNYGTDIKDLNSARVQDHDIVDNPYGDNNDPKADTKFINKILEVHKNAPEQDYNTVSFNANGRNCHNYTTSLVEGAGGKIPGDFKPTGASPGLGESIPGMVNNNSNQSSKSTSKSNNPIDTNKEKAQGLWNKIINFFKSKKHD